MAFRCEICGKSKLYGHNVSFSQRKTKRVWKPNLQVKRLQIGDSKVKLKICTQCLRRLKKQELGAKGSQPAKTPTTNS